MSRKSGVNSDSGSFIVFIFIIDRRLIECFINILGKEEKVLNKAV